MDYCLTYYSLYEFEQILTEEIKNTQNDILEVRRSELVKNLDSICEGRSDISFLRHKICESNKTLIYMNVYSECCAHVLQKLYRLHKDDSYALNIVFTERVCLDINVCDDIFNAWVGFNKTYSDDVKAAMKKLKTLFVTYVTSVQEKY